MPLDLNLRKKLEQHLEDLPVLPTVIAKLFSLDPKADDYFEQILNLLEVEPNFSARILAAANSVASSPKTPITTVRGALSRIGAVNASDLLLAVAVTRVFVPRDDWEKSLWRHAIQVGLAARSLVKYCADEDLRADEAYTCALLHDIGRFVMFQEAPDQLRKIDEAEWDTPDSLVQQELAICGLSHPELGARACTKWKLPDLIVQVVRDHHTPPSKLPPGKAQKLAALIRFADVAMFPSAMPGSPGLADADEATIQSELESKIPGFLNISVPQLHKVIQFTATEGDAICHAIGVG